jgi:outer membrane protein OmpA-like peptidoglycan-associated protein
MSNGKFFIFIAIMVCMALPTVVVGQQDDEGCKDSALLTRPSGCHITSCSASEFDAAELVVSTTGNTRTKHVEGKVEKINYDCNGKSALQVRRNVEGALQSAGFKLDFTGYDVPTHYVTGHKGGIWLSVEASELTGDSQYRFISVVTGEMTQEMTADAKAWADEINKSGHAAVYGVEFDLGKATLRPESEKVLVQVAALLNSQPDWQMKVEGHTDSTGSRGGNQVLSQQRAATVVAWLVKDGIAGSRLTAVGLGDTKPIADNSTDEGRTRNRRVELVKR